MIEIDWSLGVSAVIFLITLLVLNRILFRPLFQVLEKRKGKTTDLVEEAARNESYYSELVDRYREQIKEEKQAGYKLAEEKRAEALRQRQSHVSDAREEAGKILAQAKDRIESDLGEARGKLAREAESIATLITRQILKGS